MVGSDEVLIADGHHRYGVARLYRDEVRAGDAISDRRLLWRTLALVGELARDQLSLDAVHRLVTGIPGAQVDTLLSGDFDMSTLPSPGRSSLPR